MSIDCTTPSPRIIKGHLGFGTAKSPDGQTIGADSRSLYLNGKPWIPLAGEFHFSRYPAIEWRSELLKMKAGGLDTVSTYAFWIHHEEMPGEWDWSGQRSLREFVETCREVGLKVIVRLGPFSHGEVRNGGIPDWVRAQAPEKQHRRDPEFMALAEQLYSQISRQIAGRLWKDGGPVIGVQLDNECVDLPYLFALKRIARKCDIDVPLYSVTAWDRVPIPEGGILPMFEGYPDGYWFGDAIKHRTQYFFTPSPLIGNTDIISPGKNHGNLKMPGRLVRFPYLCCEIVGGMISSYEQRISIAPEDCASLAMVKLGCGNNMCGYYMYHGGINPEGKYSTLNESRSAGGYCDAPVRDYDYMAPIGAYGQVRRHYHLLRAQNLFLKEWGPELARMPPHFPHKKPTGLDDTQTVRWSVRSNGSRAFLFFNNYQRCGPLPPKEGVQFSLKMKTGRYLLPNSPVTIPSGAYGVWPVNMDCAGVNLAYATAQPLGRLDIDKAHWFFFAAIDGIDPEFAINDKKEPTSINKITPGTGIAFSRLARDKSMVHFVVLTPDQARDFWIIPVAGRMRAVLCRAALLPESDRHLQIETLGSTQATLAIMPPVKKAVLDGVTEEAVQDGVFQRFTAKSPPPPVLDIAFEKIMPPLEKTDLELPERMHQKIPETPEAWRLRLPAGLSLKNYLMRIHYSGDVAELYAGRKLIIDNFYNGSPFDIGLWSIPNDDPASLVIHIPAPSRLVSITALPRKYWDVYWDDGP